MRTRTTLPAQSFHPLRIGPYEVLRRLGAGTMGEVYLARSASSRLVAVKTIRAGLAEDSSYRRRFSHEVAAARLVSGAFTAAVVDADPDAELPWLATVFVPAPSLTELVAVCGPLPVPAVRWLAAGCAEALDCVHRAGLVHRDFKPGNVLVTADGPRVIDFGLARADGTAQGTAAGIIVGTPSYMAPEQATGFARAGPAADVFSLGATLLYAATGSPPYRSKNGVEVIFQLMTEHPDLSDVPEDLREMLAGCLARNPVDRPGLGELVAALAPHLAGAVGLSPLPETALQLIEEHRRALLEPTGRRGQHRTSGFAGDGSVERSGGRSGSGEQLSPHPSLPPSGAGSFRAQQRPSRRRQRVGRVGRVSRARRRRGVRYGTGRPLGLVGLVAVIAVAVAASVIGALALVQGLHLSGDSSAAPQVAGPAPASAESVTAQPAQNPPPLGPPPLGPPPRRPPPGAVEQSNGLFLSVEPPFGDMHTNFVLHGNGWPANGIVLVSLVGSHMPPVRTVVDGGGNFNYAVNQNHDLFAPNIPDGVYTVRAASGALVETVRFVIGPAPAPAPGPPPP